MTRLFPLRWHVYQPNGRDAASRLFRQKWTGYVVDNSSPQDHQAIEHWARQKFPFGRGGQVHISDHYSNTTRILFRSVDTKEEFVQFISERAAKRSIEFEVRIPISFDDLAQQMQGRMFGLFRLGGKVWISTEDCPEAAMIKLATN